MGFAILALLAAQLPSVFPPSLPDARVPVWLLLAALSGGLAALISLRPRAPRPLVLGLGWVLMIAAVLQAFLVGDLVALFATWLVVPAVSRLAGQLRPRPRKALVAAHVLAAACWVGIALTVTAMALVAMTTTDIETGVAAYALMTTFDITLLPWANFATILTGLALGVTTGWGLVRYYWVAVKLTIAVSILFMAFGFLHDALERAHQQAMRLAADGGTTAELTADADVAFWGFGTSLLGLVAAMLLSLYKPGGRTRHGRRLPPARRPARELRVTVADRHESALGTIELTLRALGGEPLPGWEPGAHIDLVLPSGRVRQYSLCGDPAQTGTYRIAVLEEPDGRGGSTEIHGLRTGMNIGIRGPRNNFPLVDAPAYLFVAGGIGITPFLPMIERLDRRGADWRLVYRGRSLPTMAFAATLRQRYPRRVTLLPADTHARPDLEALLAQAPADTAVYCCGPEELLRAAEIVAAQHPGVALHTERFAASNRSENATNAPFEAELRRSGVVVHIPADRTLLSAIQEVDPTVDLSCEDGVCGSCATRVLAGTPDHRDDVLRAADRDRTDIIYPCVSRARGERIVLDV
ncbi:PDR/VanB family oxidoreductase [Nocardia goodfellowii]|uniref:Ferredoxin-NADP reductase n=1 Tax=Nocardia goodfellowii TaxID=882446 RepID=A0ABS4QKX1_9NOCA|nr:PDR/VanB family oxidoreductase [Nocardia goodfellowii]MBP2191780.1 ferredoxin-NADP reductase [Nocardia goodfellowii]